MRMEASNPRRKELRQSDQIESTHPGDGFQPDTLFKLGGIVGDRMLKPAEHRRFTTARRRRRLSWAV
ncbi:hypothetical protein [Haloferula sp.]|uniref:hypothetical protein n=1 Tax=Haloferula sp. TaxID=2497595 RepID=UPI003C77C3E9